ncbi:MAG: hypothetical protein AAFW69_00760 [Pseudomonadota bacterium]
MRLACLVLAVFTAQPAIADEEVQSFGLGPDRFVAGERVVHSEEGIDDLFMAGNRVTLEAALAGSAHLAGREVEVVGAVGGDLYAAASEIELSAPVSGDATLTAYEVEIESGGAVGGDLRAAAADVEVAAAIGGGAILAGDLVELDAAVAGDAAIAAREIVWGPGARIDGRLRVYAEDPEAVTVPERVASADRVEVLHIERFDREQRRGGMLGALVGGVLLGALTVAALSYLALSVAPEAVVRWRRLALAQPLRAGVSGALVLALLFGLTGVLGMSVIGIPLIPALGLLIGLASFAGLAFGIYVLGLGTWMRLGGTLPEAHGTRAAIAGSAALVVGLLSFVPLLGWLLLLALTFLGVGTLAAHFLPRQVFLTAR